MLYQALIGAWEGHADTAFAERMEAFALKAAREGKQETSWTNPNADYEVALKRFIRALLDPTASAGFLASFAAFAERTALLGALNSLSQLALKTLLPGVPDFYQGTERWDFSLVDPDNRRRVDFASRETMAMSSVPPLAELAHDWRDGRIKQALTHRLLAIRQAHDGVFRSGAYTPLEVSGEHTPHIVAFARTTPQDEIVVAIGRHFAPLTGGGRHWPSGWRAALHLPEGARYLDALGTREGTFTGSVELSNLFSEIPVCVLQRQ
jgi:(1->4)-alpha-D-glucan 1-alpha-D-glucosylmutase